MNISDVDLKKLWGKAAGRCSFPECPNNCISFFEKSGDIILGEMAHVMPQSSNGPRGTQGVVGSDTYENLILLCPLHHRTIDKAPNDFPGDLLRGWKYEHELKIEEALASPQFSDAKSLFYFASKLLIENHAIHKKYGPESLVANKNPLSEGVALWSLRKSDTILPNNQKIVNAFVRNHDYLSLEQWKLFVEFREHAVAFEKNTHERMDREAVPQFPLEFQKMITSYAE